LTPAAGPSELVGFRSITPADDPHELPGENAARPVADLFARRACHEQARLDFERWREDGGSLVAEAISWPLPER
jgi:hypothetical protein